MLAVCKALDRSNRQALCALPVYPDGTQQVIPAEYDAKQIPWPLATVELENPMRGLWRCRRPLGDRRELVRDDFLHVDSVSLGASGGSTASATASGDTRWTIIEAASNNGGSTAQSGGLSGGVGCCRLTANGGGAGPGGTVSLIKDQSSIVVPAAPAALHLSGRFAFSSSLYASGPTYQIGFSDFGIASPAMVLEVQYNTGVFYLVNANRGVSVAQASVVTAGTFYYFDLLFCSSFGAVWVNADGPYGIANATTGATTIDVNNDVLGMASSSAYLDVDYLHLDLVSPVADLAAVRVNAQ